GIARLLEVDRVLAPAAQGGRPGGHPRQGDRPGVRVRDRRLPPRNERQVALEGDGDHDQGGDRKPIRVKAAAAGTYVLAIRPSCYHGEDGPFSFTVAVSHKAA